MAGLFGFLARGAGLAVGANVAREALTKVGQDARPVVKGAVRAGLAAAGQIEAWTAEARAEFANIVAEARAEEQKERASKQ